MSKNGHLNPKQKRFVVSYLKTGNASEAARIAYPDNKNPDVRAMHSLHQIPVQEAIQEAFRKYDQQIDQEVGNLINIANHDPMVKLASGEQVIKANEMLLKLRGAFNQPNVNLNFTIDGKIKEMTKEEAQKMVDQLREKL